MPLKPQGSPGREVGKQRKTSTKRTCKSHVPASEPAGDIPKGRTRPAAFRLTGELRSKSRESGSHPATKTRTPDGNQAAGSDILRHLSTPERGSRGKAVIKQCYKAAFWALTNILSKNSVFSRKKFWRYPDKSYICTRNDYILSLT